jgi:drug/metabolite transporter (DMT)-like permease
VRPELRNRLVAAALAVLAALLWATYYLFVLAVSPSSRPSAVLLYPFVSGGAAYALWAGLNGHARSLGRLFADPRAYLRVLLLVGMQLSVLAATYATGPVDASLLSLLGDVVVTPLLVAALVSAHRPELRAPAFVTGLVLSVVGGTLTIAGGQSLGAIHDFGWLVVLAVPVTVALYFVLSARAGAEAPLSAVVAQSMLGAAAGTFVISPLVPGGVHGLLAVGPAALALLLLNGLLSFFLAPVCYFRSIEKAGLVFPPMLMTGIPVFTLLLSATVLGIAPAPLAVLGVPVAALGGIVALAAGIHAPPDQAGGPAGGLTASR